MTDAADVGQRASTWTPTEYARNGAVQIAYDRLAGSEGDPLLLVMGLAVSRFWWPAGLCQEFARQRLAVARYDQRDAGQSTRLPGTGGSNPLAAVARRRGAYSAEDMTDDAVAVLDALGWEQEHIFGASLGGVIAQRIALRHPDRVLSVVSAAAVPSDVSGIRLGRYIRFGLLARLARARFPEGRDGDIQLSLMLAREVASPAYPFDEDAAREWIEREVDSGPGTPRRKAGRPAPSGAARSCASCASPCSSCTATTTPSCASAPPAPPRKPLTAPAWWSSRVSVTTSPRRCGQPSPKRSASSPTGRVPRPADRTPSLMDTGPDHLCAGRCTIVRHHGTRRVHRAIARLLHRSW